jgi:hypothetical protein
VQNFVDWRVFSGKQAHDQFRPRPVQGSPDFSWHRWGRRAALLASQGKPCSGIPWRRYPARSLWSWCARKDIGWLSPLALEDVEQIAPIAEFGVVFLLFMIGLELSWQWLAIIGRLVFGLGAARRERRGP